MLIAVPPEPDGETRTAGTAETEAQLTAEGHEVVSGDEAVARLSETDVVLGVRPLGARLLERLRPGTVTCSFLEPELRADEVARRTDLGVVSLAMDKVPRVAGAQRMDALTSQSMVAGYRAAVLAAERSPMMFGRQSTAVGVLGPATVLVLGAGVAGLQAIATCRRLGAEVTGYDVRASSAADITSLGACALDLGLGPLDGVAGYARELDARRARDQLERLGPHVADADVVITTAAVPGRRPPVLLDRATVQRMRTGAVVIDLAVGPPGSGWGNVEGSVAGLTTYAGVRVYGEPDAARQLPALATMLYARNVAAVVQRLVQLDGRLADDPVLGPMAVTSRTAPTARDLTRNDRQ